MVIERNTSSLRMKLSIFIEKYDILMLRRLSLIQYFWNAWTQRKAKSKIKLYADENKTVDEFVAYMAHNEPDHRFNEITLPGFSDAKNEKFVPLIDLIKDDLNGKSFFDIGPGYGHSLDLAQAAGTSHTGFMDIDPAFFVYNELKGHRGFFGNYIKGKGLSVVAPNTFDYILSRGSLNSDQFNDEEAGIIPFPKLVDMIENIWSGNGAIIINPTFNRGDTPDQYYWCKDKDAFLKSPFATELLSRGYSTEYIDEFNHPNYHPFTFIKRPE